MFILNQKLKAIKTKLKAWNQFVFDNIHSNVSSAMNKVDEVQRLIDSNGYSDSLIEQEKSAQMDLQRMLHYEEELWHQNSRMQWVLEGDTNTKFFHKMTTIKAVSKKISMLKVGDDVISRPADLENHVVGFYESLFNASNGCVDNGLIEDVISPMVFSEDNFMLTSLPLMEAIKNVVFFP